MGRICRQLILLYLTGTIMFAETNGHDQLQHLLVLERQGSAEKVVEGAQQLIAASILNSDDEANAQILLGSALQDQGDYNGAQSAYEKAMIICSKDFSDTRTCGTAMEDLADLYQEIGEPVIAINAEHKALVFFQNSGDHRLIARSEIHLASLELNMRNRRAAKQYLNQTISETKHLHDPGDELSAFIFSTKGWLAALSSDFNSACQNYENALVYWKKMYGDWHRETGWTYLLAGKAYLRAGHDEIAAQDFEKGLSILSETVGRENAKYAAGQMAYAELLDHMGASARAMQLRQTAEKTLAEISRERCDNCRVSVYALR